MAGRQIEIAADGGKFDAYIAASDAGKGPGLVIVTHIYGVDPDTKGFCDDLARRGCVALAQNFFGRDRDSGVLHHDAEGGKRARERAGRIDFAKSMDDLKRAIAEVKRHPSCNGKVAVLGFCFGGAYVYRAACDLGIDLGASFHGTFVSKSIKPGDRLGCPVTFHYGDNDELAPPAELDAVRKAVTARSDGEMIVHPGAGHGYMFPSRPTGFHPEAAKASWARTMQLLGALRVAPAPAAE
jgi:carboxymethylenebutenolidase